MEAATDSPGPKAVLLRNGQGELSPHCFIEFECDFSEGLVQDEEATPSCGGPLVDAAVDNSAKGEIQRGLKRKIFAWNAT